MKVFNEAIRKGLECKEKPPDDFFDEVMEFLHEDDRPKPAAAPAPAAGPEGGEEAAGAPAQDEAAAPAEAGTLLVTVPEGVSAGMQLEIQAPDGRTLAVTVPEGVFPGQQLQVNA